jgi:hypothetical protein
MHDEQQQQQKLQQELQQKVLGLLPSCMAGCSVSIEAVFSD